VAGFDEIETLAAVCPFLTVMAQPALDLGAPAAQTPVVRASSARRAIEK